MIPIRNRRALPFPTPTLTNLAPMLCHRSIQNSLNRKDSDCSDTRRGVLWGLENVADGGISLVQIFGADETLLHRDVRPVRRIQPEALWKCL